MYRKDLAYIHHQGFSEFAESAAAGVLELLGKHGIRDGVIVDIGCGSGILSRELVRAGFDVHGFDASPSMIALARKTAPEAAFRVATFERAPIPACEAIVAMGEVLNYGTITAVRKFVKHACDALRPGGLLLFDVAERDGYPPRDDRHDEGEDWAVFTIKDSDGTHLRRRLITFRRHGRTMRRDEEVHVLELYDRAGLTALLREHGFRVMVRRSYGTRRLPKGHAVYVATKRKA
jgi:SAM-dependent methyltransferase